MKFKKPHFKVRYPDEGQKRRIKNIWDLTDKCFKLMQWLFFLSLLGYIGDKANSKIILIATIALSVLVYRTVTDTISGFFEIGTASPNGREVSTLLELVVVLIFTAGLLFIYYILFVTMSNVFAQFQSSK